MPPEKQVEAVAKKLQELNPGFDGKMSPTIDSGVVTVLAFNCDTAADISPVRALQGLRIFACTGGYYRKGKLSDLSPLKGMKLTHLHCWHTQVADLSPLQGMQLNSLACGATAVSDLSPIKGMPLTDLRIGETKVKDISILKGMPLRTYEGPARSQDLEILRSIPSLVAINGAPAKDVLK
jgi:hypothetical protein